MGAGSGPEGGTNRTSSRPMAEPAARASVKLALVAAPKQLGWERRWLCKRSSKTAAPLIAGCDHRKGEHLTIPVLCSSPPPGFAWERASRREKGAHRHGDVDRDPAQGARRGRFEALDPKGLRGQAADAREDPGQRRTARLSTARAARPKPKLGQFLPVIDEILASRQDRTRQAAPHGQTHL